MDEDKKKEFLKEFYQKCFNMDSEMADNFAHSSSKGLLGNFSYAELIEWLGLEEISRPK